MAELQNVSGLAELQRALAQLPIRVARNALRGSVNSGATVIRKEAMHRAPVRTGKLKASIYQRFVREQSGPMQATYYVGVRSGKSQRNKIVRRRVKGQVVSKTIDRDAFYWRFQEFGTAKQSARPFLRPAFEARKYEAVQRIKDYLAARVQAEAAAL